MPEIKTICCVCQKVLSITDSFGAPGGISHGYCPQHAKELMERSGLSSHDEKNTCGCWECERDREQESVADNALRRGEERYDRKVQEGE